MLRRQILATVELALLICFLSSTHAQESRPRSQTNPSTGPTGLLTNRLSSKELDRWRAIEELVFAEDDERHPLHPILRWLWQWIDTSGHAVYIEVVRANRISTCTAGSFSIERFDAHGERHVAVIKINLPSIDQAYAGPNAARADGFIPFTDLDRDERYAEVLGHEMAHAVYILTDFNRARMVMTYVEETNKMLLSQYAPRMSGPMTFDLRTRLSKRDALLKDLEAQAEGVEKKVWRELVESKSKREKGFSLK